MGNQFDDWKNSKLPASQAWAQRGLAWAAAGTVTAAVWLSVVLMAGLDLPASAPGYLEAAASRSAPIADSSRSASQAASPLSLPVAGAPAPQMVEPVADTRSVRHAAMLPRVTITGKREPALQQPDVPAFEVGVAPTAPASGGPSAGITVAGDNLNQ